MEIIKFVRELKEGRVEGEITKTIFVSLATSLIIFAVVYYFRLRSIEGFFDKYGFYLFFSFLSYAVIIPSVRQVRSFKEFPCMTGMMIGMTIGMISGFLSGFYIGATNGMFWGSVFGMSVGILFGTWNGKCCGAMGFMEGIMAGFMGGLMGAMTAIMMFNDNLKAAGVIVFAVCSVIIFGLNFMIYKETREFERKHKDSTLFTIIWSFILTTATIWLMALGPRSVLLQ